MFQFLYTGAKSTSDSDSENDLGNNDDGDDINADNITDRSQTSSSLDRRPANKVILLSGPPGTVLNVRFTPNS